MISPSVIGSVSDSAFHPRMISNLQLWYDAADSATLFNNPTGSVLASPSGAIGRWEDKSPNLWHATQSVASQQPRRITGSLYNGLDTVRFEGAGLNTVMYVTGAVGLLNNKTEMSAFIVSTCERNANFQGFFGISSSGSLTPASRYSLAVFGGDGRLFPIISRLNGQSHSALFNSRTVCYSGSGLNLYANTIRYNVSSSTLYTNGTICPTTSLPTSYSGSTSAVNSNFVSVGSAIGNSYSLLYLVGNMAEIIYYDKFLNDTERKAVERYLTRKWNIRSYDQKTSFSTDIFSSLELYVDAGNAASYPGTGTTWTDISGKGRNGTLVNGTAYDTSGSIASFSFDGTDDYISFGNVLNFTSESFTLSSWARVTVGDTTNGNSWICGTNDVTTVSGSATPVRGYSLYVNSSDKTATNNAVVFSTYQASANQFNVTQYSMLLGNNWVFYTVTRSGSIVKIFVNGVYCTTTVVAVVNPDSSPASFTVGTLPGLNQPLIQPSVMKLASVIAHSKALSDQEVLELYNFTKGRYNITD